MCQETANGRRSWTVNIIIRWFSHRGDTLSASQACNVVFASSGTLSIKAITLNPLTAGAAYIRFFNLF